MKKCVENRMTRFRDRYDRIRYVPLIACVPAVCMAMIVLSAFSLGVTLLTGGH